MLCDTCGREGARTRRATETYFTADTLHEIERIKLHHKSFAVERPVPVAKFV